MDQCHGTTDLAAHQLVVESSDGWSISLSLAGQSEAGLCQRISATFAAVGIELEPDLLAAFDGEKILPYDIEAIGRFRQVINWVDEQMNFGFVTGDGSIPDAYFYITAYPVPDNWADLALPEGAYWHTEGWTGAVLPYATLVSTAHPFELLLDYLRSLQAHGSKLMGK